LFHFGAQKKTFSPVPSAPSKAVGFLLPVNRWAAVLGTACFPAMRGEFFLARQSPGLSRELEELKGPLAAQRNKERRRRR